MWQELWYAVVDVRVVDKYGGGGVRRSGTSSVGFGDTFRRRQDPAALLRR